MNGEPPPGRHNFDDPINLAKQAKESPHMRTQVFDQLMGSVRDKGVSNMDEVLVFGAAAKELGRNEGYSLVKAVEANNHGVEPKQIKSATAQYERQKNKRQVIQKMKARMEDGYWCLPSVPPGFSYTKDPLHGKLIVCVEPYKTLYKTAIEDFRDGILITIEDFRHFILSQYKEKGINKKLLKTGARNILKDILYTGWLEYEKWNVMLRKGEHEGIINMETYDVVQERLKGRAKAWRRKDYSADFALRGYLICDSCGNKMTASWSTGRTERYAYSSCTFIDCPDRYKEA